MKKKNLWLGKFAVRRGTSFRYFSVLSVLAVTAIAGCEQRADVVIADGSGQANPVATGAEFPGDTAYRFGFDIRSTPMEDARQYLPFLDFLKQQTGMGFELIFTPKGEEVAERLGSGKIDFAAMGAVSFVQANVRYRAVSVARGLNESNAANYRSKLVVQPGSPIRTVAELRGRRFAFGSESSTQGHLIPRIILAGAGIQRKDLGEYIFTGSHFNCANAVVSGKADACGMQDTMADEFARKGQLKIIHTSDPFPSSGIAAGRQVSAEVVATVRQALLSFDPKGKHKATLYNWDKTEMPNGFVAAEAKDYEHLRTWMLKLKFLEHN